MAATTRFAPSPTGLLHLGNARVAVLSALVARASGGRFLLRFDDTDPSRSEERFIEAARRDLRWLGLGWDAEFRQSERLSLYEDAAAALRKQGRLYPCYETPDELSLRRRAQLSAGRPPVYDRAALRLSADERAALEAEGRRPHWRFRLEGVAEWEDAVLGPQRVAEGAVSDPVLIREDGTMLYTLASVVDDAEMGISDIVRGADHLTNTAAQAQIFDALGAARPRFGHVSLLTAPGGAAFSKRDGARSLAALRDEGVEPEAALSLMATLGSSRDPQLFADLDAAAEGFSLARFGAAPTAFDADALDRLSIQRLRGMAFDEAAPRLAALGIAAEPAIWSAIQPNIERIHQVSFWLRLIEIGADPAHAPEDSDFVIAALSLLPPPPREADTWRNWTQAVKAETGRKGAALFRPLRLALTGRGDGPDMALLLPLLRRLPDPDEIRAGRLRAAGAR